MNGGRNSTSEIYQCITLWVEQWWEPQKRVLIDAVGQVFSEHRASVRETITNLKERVIRLETTSNFEERFTRLAHEVKRGSEIPQGELLEKIEALQRQLDDLKRVAGQPGPQGPPGKLPRVKEYVAECVHYESDVVTHEGALYQAKRDTAQPPGGSDWVCVARAGRDALTPTIRGTYNVYEKYQKLDIIVSDGAAFIASKDNPGLLPGPDWQLLSRQGKRGQRGEKGDPGPRGEKGDQGPAVMPRLVSSEIDENYNLTILRSDNSLEIIPLRPAFERFLLETNS
jgi:hypothetical protein